MTETTAVVTSIQNGVVRVKTENPLGDKGPVEPVRADYKTTRRYEYYLYDFKWKNTAWQQAESNRRELVVDKDEFRVEAWFKADRFCIFPSGKHFAVGAILIGTIEGNVFKNVRIKQ